MAELRSVGIEVTESDLTAVTQPVSTSIGAYVGHFNWGPAHELVNVSSETQLGQIFGTPSKKQDDTSGSFLTAESFLKYGNTLRVIRTLDTGALNSKGEPSGYGTTEQALHLPNKTVFENTFASLTAPFYARYCGELGDSLGIQIFHADNLIGTSKPILDRIAEMKRFFSTAPESSIWAEEISETKLTNDEIHIIVYDKNGLITGLKNTVLESYQGLSLNSNAKATSGVNNYFVDVLNTSSAYVYAANPLDIADLNTTTNTYTLIGDGVINFSGGDNGSVVFGNMQSALTLLEDTDNVDVNLVFAQGFEDDVETTVNDALIKLVEVRKDCMVFLSAPLTLYKEPTDLQKFNVLKNWRNELITNSGNQILSYCVFDSTPVYVYNRYSDTFEWIPACGHIAGLCAYTDQIAEPWFSPAGFNRGQLRGLTKLAYNPKSFDRDELYNLNINPIVNIPGQGIILYGDKTGQKRPTAFDRINVRRLFITIQRVIADAAKYQLFELNDEFTRNAFINIVDPYLRDVQGGRGITDYRVVCDETNNTAQVIDTNRFVADIYIKPARSINFISLNFIATRTGVSFTEIGA